MKNFLNKRKRPSCTAVLCVRDGHVYLHNILQYLFEEGVEVQLILHDRSDYSELLSTFKTDPLHVRRMKPTDDFSLREQLKERSKASLESDSDWILNLDVDEVPHSFKDSEGLMTAIERIANYQFNVIDFHEFVFLPVDFDYDSSVGAIQPMKHYYFHEPHPNRLNRIFRRELGFPTSETGGHTARGADIRVAPERMALRHYMFRDSNHARIKYCQRQFDVEEVQNGWHVNRIGVPESHFAFPDESCLERLLVPDTRSLNTSNPRFSHYWHW